MDFKRKRPRPKLRPAYRLFWSFLRKIYSGWADLLMVVKQETVVSWQHAGFRLLWRWRSPGTAGRPILSFRSLYCFFDIELGCRRILAFNCNSHLTADRTFQQLRQAFPDPWPYRYVEFDWNAKFGNDVVQFIRSTGLRVLRSSVRCPW